MVWTVVEAVARSVVIVNQLLPFAAHSAPVLVAAAGERAQTCYWEFFVSNIRNPHTRCAYGRALHELLAWCEQHGVASLTNRIGHQTKPKSCQVPSRSARLMPIEHYFRATPLIESRRA